MSEVESILQSIQADLKRQSEILTMILISLSEDDDPDQAKPMYLGQRVDCGITNDPKQD